MNQVDRNAAPLHRGDSAQSLAGLTDAPFHLRFDPPFLTLADDGSEASLGIAIPAITHASDLYLVADIYLSDHHAHPSGHAGWWSFAITGGAAIALNIRIADRRLSVLQRDGGDIDRWVNPDFELPPSKTLVMHLLYRQRHNHAIVHSQSLHIYRDAAVAAAAARDRASIRGDLSSIAALPRAQFLWPSGSTIRIVAQNLPPAARLARNRSAMQLTKLLAREAIDCRLYAASFDPGLCGAVSHIGNLKEDTAASDLLMIFYDDHLQELPWLCRLPCAKIFYFLGLPSSARLQAFDAEAHERYAKARAAVRHIVDCDIWAAATPDRVAELAHHFVKAWLSDDEEERPRSTAAANTDALNEDAARKILARLAPADRLWLQEHFDSGTRPSADVLALCERAVARQTLHCRQADRDGIWASVESLDALDLPASGPALLYSGRLSPGEGIVEVIELFTELRKIAADSCLVIAGDRPVPAFLHYLEYLLSTRFAGIRDRVILSADPEDRLLKSLYGRADALIHLGPGGPGLLGDAVYFRKPLFTAAGFEEDGRAGRPAGYRLYGDDRPGQAARLHDLLIDSEALAGLLDCQQRDLAALRAAPDCLSIWPLLELAAARIAAP